MQWAIPKLDSNSEEVAVLSLHSISACPSITETAEADNAHDTMGEMLIFSLGENRGIPTGATDPPFAA